MRRYVLIAGSGCAVLAVALLVLFPRGGASQEQLPTEASVILFTGKNFTGKQLVVSKTILDMPSMTLEDGITKFTWNDNVRSIIVVSGTWRIYQHGRLNTVLDDTPLDKVDIATQPPVRGWSCLVSGKSDGPLEIPDVETGGLDEDMSSIEFVSEANLPDWAFN